MEEELHFWDGLVVTCYFRHLQEVFKKAGINVTNDNEREVDKAVRKMVSVSYKDCPTTRKVKKRISEGEERFILALKTEWNKHA